MQAYFYETQNMQQEVILTKSCPPCFELAKFNRISLPIPVWMPEYKDITLSQSHM